MRKTTFILVALLIIASLMLGGCNSTPSSTTTTVTQTTPAITSTPTPTPTPSPTPSLTITANQTLTPTPTETTPPPDTETPTETPTPTPTPVVSVKLTDTLNDLFDKNGYPTTSESFFDIFTAEVYADGTDYVAIITLNGTLPTQTLNSQLMYEWDIYVDGDRNYATGVPWNIVSNDLGVEYFARLILLDNIFFSEVRNLNTDHSERIDNIITNNVIELRWPQNFYPTTSFYFVVAAKKYGERGLGSAFMLADHTPDTGHSLFP